MLQINVYIQITFKKQRNLKKKKIRGKNIGKTEIKINLFYRLKTNKKTKDFYPIITEMIHSDS